MGQGNQLLQPDIWEMQKVWPHMPEPQDSDLVLTTDFYLREPLKTSGFRGSLELMILKINGRKNEDI